MSNDFRNLNTIPAGALGLLPLESCKEIGEEVDKYLVTLAVGNVHNAVLKTHDAAGRDLKLEDRKSTRLNSSHVSESRMPSSA